MDERQIEQVRRFNRVVTQHVGALEDSYLQRGRPLGQARLPHEIGSTGIDVRSLRERLKLDDSVANSNVGQSNAGRGLRLGSNAEESRNEISLSLHVVRWCAHNLALADH
jgi:hypothetical protein